MSKKSRSKLSIVLTISLMILMLVAAGCGTQTEAPSTDNSQANSTQPTDNSQPSAPATIDYPTKDIEMVYHSSAGSGGDIFLRSLGKALAPALGKEWVVNNVTGASGANAWNYVAKAQPDGYTLLGVSSTIITAPILNNMPVSYKDFEPVAMMFNDPMVLFVPANSPLKTLQDLVDAAKANPGKLKFAGGTPGELGFVAGKLFMKAAGFDMALVPFDGGGDAAVTVLGGHLDGGIGEYGEISSNVEAGKLRIIGAFNKMPLKPDVQTVQEAGFNMEPVEKFRGVLAPKGTPQAVLDKLAAAFKTAYDDPDFKKYFEPFNMIPNFKSGADFEKAMADQDKQIRDALAAK